jgi:hypothetical protein
MTWRSRSILFCIFLAGLFSGCGGGNQTGMTPVTVTVGGGRTSPKAISRSALLSKATPTVASITFTIKGPGMDDVVRVVPISPPQTVTEVFYLLNGPDRTFLIEARDGANTIIYSGSMMADLNGTPVTVALPLQYMLFNRLVWSSWGDEAKAVARDVNGDLIVVGLTYGGLEGNLNQDPAHATFDIFVTKLSPTGAPIWTRQFGTAVDDDAYSVATDTSRNIFVTGATNSGLNERLLSGTTDAYVMKLDTNGIELWTRLTGTSGALTAGNSITVDAAGNAYMTGYTTGGLNGNSNAGSFDMFVTKFSTTGLRQWTAQQGTALDESGNGIVLDASGANVYVAGSTHGGLKSSPTGTDFTNPGPSTTTDIFLMMFSATSGSWQWTKQVGSIDSDDAWALAVDQTDGSVYVAGGTAGNLVTANSGLYDMMLIKFNASGAPQWAQSHQLGSTGTDIATAVTVDVNRDVIVTGKTSGTFDGIPGDGFDDLFVVKYDRFGGHSWSREFGTKASDWGIGVVTDTNRFITVVGNTFGGFTSSATEDIFVLQYNDAGTKLP